MIIELLSKCSTACCAHVARLLCFTQCEDDVQRS